MKKFMDWAKVNNAIEVLFEPRLSDGTIKKFDAMAKRHPAVQLTLVWRIIGSRTGLGFRVLQG